MEVFNFKFLKIITVLCLTIGLTSCGSATLESKICNSYEKWNAFRDYSKDYSFGSEKYESYTALELREWTNLIELSTTSNELVDAELLNYLKGWTQAGLSNDAIFGEAMASGLLIRCQDLGFDFVKQVIGNDL
jgi:hypothetical protein